MSTQSASISIQNNTGGTAQIFLFHTNSTNGQQSGSWTAANNETVGPLTVYFETGPSGWGVTDWWAAMAVVSDGPNAGTYVSLSELDVNWKECELESGDDSSSPTFAISTSELSINLDSGGTTCGMQKLSPSGQISHVFVVMLENHSFDNIFALSGISGITAATSSDSNSYNDNNYSVGTGAPYNMPTDPGHEFPDVVEQLAGANASYPTNGPYPTINNSGFVANYATSTSEDTGLPTTAELGDIMLCFDTPTVLPVIYGLATSFAICDNWHSSLPGPTWPNRFFLHGASSSGLDTSPTTGEIATWETVDGFKYPNGSIFAALDGGGIPYRLYNDANGALLSLFSDDSAAGSAAGAVTQVASLTGIFSTDINSVGTLGPDLQTIYPFPYTFIEPHYGDIVNNTYAGGSSQHPMDNMYGGEGLLAYVYGCIRNSPYWESSLLVVLYDEHGGFYDSVAPGPAPAPGDNPDYGYNTYGFNFEQYGVRVPAVVISPLIPAGTVDHTLYDHTSVLKTLETLFNLGSLTKRDAAANDLLSLLSLSTPRTDCPQGFPPGPPPAVNTEAQAAKRRPDNEAVPTTGNLAGALYVARKADYELSGQTPEDVVAVKARHAAVKTRGDARAYISSILNRVEAAKAAKHNPTKVPAPKG
ncbi:alkaline phosphatase family protein [Nitrospirillum iridis]|uniref:Phospholipase C n=1 Tax=Nitrospirillum iridis TaxID=765888 RepID=A0A7X0AX69_9PROT|nr:alkaline phosphatase family protein [Nitrospirillum iridis]MBB6250314.1 phospholipase C [Nitrospirillum iridis]